MSSGCLKTILDEYADSFGVALTTIRDSYVLEFNVCYGDESYHLYGRCEYCTNVRMRYAVGRLDILMRRLDDAMHVECSLAFDEAMELVAQHMSAREQLALRRLQSNYLASIGSRPS